MLSYLISWMNVYMARLEQEEGQGMAEYGLLLALIAVVCIAVLLVLGPAIAATFQTVVDNL